MQFSIVQILMLWCFCSFIYAAEEKKKTIVGKKQFNFIKKLTNFLGTTKLIFFGIANSLFT